MGNDGNRSVGRPFEAREMNSVHLVMAENSLGARGSSGSGEAAKAAKAAESIRKSLFRCCCRSVELVVSKLGESGSRGGFVMMREGVFRKPGKNDGHKKTQVTTAHATSAAASAALASAMTAERCCRRVNAQAVAARCTTGRCRPPARA